MTSLGSEERAELKRIFRDLLQIDTSNPPGNETAAARYISSVLSEQGITPKLVESEPGRGNVIAEIRGTGSKSLAFLGHLDVVPPGPLEAWETPPFAAIERGGNIFSRGAADMKNLVAAQVFAILKLKRDGFRPRGRLVLVETADEENGGSKGIGYIVNTMPELVRTDYCVTEGGGLVIDGKGGRIIGYETSEKGILWVRIVFEGEGGHASVPYLLDNAVLKVAEATCAIGEAQDKPKLTAEALEHLRALLKAHGLDQEATESNFLEVLEGVRSIDKVNWSKIRAEAAITATPTMLLAGVRPNVVPPSAQVTIDCRLPPGTDPQEAIDWLRGFVGDERMKLEIVGQSQGTGSKLDPDFEGMVARSLAAASGADGTFRYMLPAGTDSRYMREIGTKALGVEVYSRRADFNLIDSRVHAPNEFVDIDSVVGAAEFCLSLAESYLG